MKSPLFALASAGLCLALGMAAAIGQDRPTKIIDGLTGPEKSVGFAVKTLAEIDLGKEFPTVAEAAPLRFRARHVTLEPGGIVVIHSHKERPATTYIVSGTAIEYRSDMDGPIVRQAGDATMDVKGISQWWENTSDETVIMFVSDVVSTGKPADH
ncbi:MAG: cupin domain-containing protein [Pseudomonadota bacterium]